MNLKPFLQTAQKWALENSPSILTAVGTIGAISTAVLATRAGFRVGMDASTQYHDEYIDTGQCNDTLLTSKHIAQTYWKEFVPPVVVGAVTLAAIIGANRIGTRRAAALAAAFTISEKMAEEYRQKVVDTIGARKEELVRSDVARDRLERADGVETLILGEGEIIFYDSWSDRAFPSTRMRVDEAVNRVNHQINQTWSVSLTEFFELLGLRGTAVSDDFGWNTDELLSIYYTSCLLPDGRPACEIRYNSKPFQKFNKIGL